MCDLIYIIKLAHNCSLISHVYGVFAQHKLNTCCDHVMLNLPVGVTTAANLMGCNVQDLILALSTRSIQAGNDNIVQKLTLPQV